MRVVFWIEQYWPSIGGLEVLGTRYATEMRRRGHDVQVITSHGNVELPDRETHDDVPIHRFPFYQALAKRDLELLLQTRASLDKLWSELRPDIVHLAAVAPSVFFLLQTLSRHHTPMLVNMQLGALPDQAGQQDTVMERTLASAAWVTCVSRSILEETRRRVPAVTDRSSVVYNGMETPDVAPTPLALDEPRLLCLGRVMPIKGFDVAIAAMSDVRRRHPTARLVVAGDGPERPKLEAEVRRLGLDDAVEFLGWVAPEEVPNLMNEAAMGVFPSRDEPFGLVALEAAMMARPVVASSVGGLPEVVEEGVTGRLVPPDDPAALAEAISGLLSRPDTMAKMGQDARQRASRMFSWERYLESYEELYAKLLESKST